jgi:hypothetical protein
MNWTQRIAAASGATVMTLTLLGTAASADPSAPPTAPTFDVHRICEQRIPKLENRANKLLARITGGPEVAGSSAALRARAQRAKDPAQADWLNGKAQHRDDRAELLRKVLGQLDAYKQKYCGK